MAGSEQGILSAPRQGSNPADTGRAADRQSSIATSETARQEHRRAQGKTEGTASDLSEPLCKIVEQTKTPRFTSRRAADPQWTDQSGVEKYSTEVVLQSFNSTLTMLEGRSGGGGGSFGSDDAGDFGPAVRPARRRGGRWRPAVATATWTTTFRSEPSETAARAGRNGRPAFNIRTKTGSMNS